MNKIEFTLGGKAVPKARVRHTKRGISYTPVETKEYEKFIGYTASGAMIGNEIIADKPLKVSINIFMQIPASWSQKKKNMALVKQIIPVTKPDVDNVAKTIVVHEMNDYEDLAES